MKHRVGFPVLIFLLALLSANLSFGQTYTITDLGVLGPYEELTFISSQGTAINSSGMVAGVSAPQSGPPHGFIYSGGVMTDLMQGFIDPSGYGYWNVVFADYGPGINDAGKVVGRTSYEFPFFYDGTFHIMGLKCINGTTSMIAITGPSDADSGPATAINNAGQAVGWGRFRAANCIDNLGEHAYIWDTQTGAVTDIGTLASTLPSPRSFAMAINDSGQVTGYSDALGGVNGAGAVFHAFVYSGGVMKDIDLHPTVNDYHSYARSINSLGHVAGNFQSASDCCLMHSFFYDGTTTQDIDTPSLYGYTVAYGINHSDQIVGFFHEPNGPAIAVLYTPNSGPGFVILNTLIPSDSGWDLKVATGINDKGQITGYGTINNNYHAFLLTPVIPYKAYVQQPINPEGSSVFPAKRGVVPVKFTLTQDDVPTCALPPATISVTRTAGGTLGAVDESVYLSAADSGSNFKIDASACQYKYNLAASALGTGTYRVDITINGSVAGSGVFALK